MTKQVVEQLLFSSTTVPACLGACLHAARDGTPHPSSATPAPPPPHDLPRSQPARLGILLAVPSFRLGWSNQRSGTEKYEYVHQPANVNQTLEDRYTDLCSGAVCRGKNPKSRGDFPVIFQHPRWTPKQVSYCKVASRYSTVRTRTSESWLPDIQRTRTVANWRIPCLFENVAVLPNWGPSDEARV